MPREPTVLEDAACCTPLTGAAMSEVDAVALAKKVRALADPKRLRLLSLMLANDDLEACTCDLTEVLGVSQPTVSHHLKLLKDAGLVVAHRKVGTWTYYRVVPDELDAVARLISPAARAVS